MVVEGAATVLGLVTGDDGGEARHWRSLNARMLRSDSNVTESVDELTSAVERPDDDPGRTAAVLGRVDAVTGRRTAAVVGRDDDSPPSHADCRRAFLALRTRW